MPRPFGEIVRARRKAIGLTLREFCRRTSLDPSNVSRLERELVGPPQAQDALESYRKALKLELGTKECDEFYESAIAKLAEKLPKVPVTGQRHAIWVTALNLETWAASLDARSTLPRLLRRLVYAAGPSIVRLEFPAGEQIQRPGWDGIVEATSGDVFVPEGTSGWELSVDDDPQVNAGKNLDKRTKNSLGLDKSRTTFIYVTPRKWQKKAEWCARKNKLGVWREVRAYDSADLEEWLERSPAVDVWLAEILGLRPQGVSSLDEHWANLEAATGLKPEAFLTSRANQIEELKERLKGPPAALPIEARSPAEVIDFVAAVSRGSSECDALSARALIVEQRGAWKAIAASGSKLLLIVHPSLPAEPELVAEAVRQGHHVLLSSNQQAREGATSIRLPRVYRHDLEQALISSGFDRQRATRYARESGGSLTVLKRLLARFPGTTQPEWSRMPDAANLAPLLLAGGWAEASEGDRSVLAKLANQPYSEVLAVAERWLNTSDSPVMRVLSRWSLVSRDDSWHLLAPSVGADHLRRIEEVALEVLGEDDPAYELPPDKRWMASLHKKVLTHSQTLRTGLAETLALLAAKPERVLGAVNLPGRVDYIVRTLLKGKNWRRWASLSHQLPVLAEAAPEAFLEAADHDLGTKEPALVKLFEQEGQAFLSSSPHPGLLWALEGLAWEPTYLRKVSEILARLAELDPAELDPKGRLGNRPMRSLEEIFVPWHPQTTGTVEERVKVLKILAGRERNVGWRLLVSLLPDQRLTSSPTHRPSWRDWTLGWSEGVTDAEYWHQTAACAHLLVERMGSDLSRWKQLIGEFDNLPEPVQKEFLDRIGACEPNNLDASVRREITEALREKVNWHRQYTEANWSLSPEILDELEKLQRRFEPEDAVARNAWLFSPRVYELIDRRNIDVAEEQRQVSELHRKEIHNVVAESGFNGVLALAEAAEDPAAVGLALGKDGPAANEPEVLPGLLACGNEKLSNFAEGYAWARIRAAGLDWLAQSKNAGWPTKIIGRFCVRLEFERRTWEFAARMGADVEQYYWRHVHGFCHGTGEDSVAFAASMLLSHQRPFQACEVLAMALFQKCALQPELLMDALQAGLPIPGASEARYAIHQLFMELQNGMKGEDTRIDPNRLASLEWGYLGLLDDRPASPKTLHAMLRNHPEFFVQLLGLVFRSKHEPKEAARELSSEERARGHNAYQLLMQWREVPGSRDDGTVDEESLLSWIRKARELAAEQGRLEVCDSRIGEVFGHSRQTEPDGSWPCIPIRDVIEEIPTEELLRGFQIGIFNSRGMHGRLPTEGGKQEWALAQRYYGYAEACKIEWDKTAAALRQMAQRYEEDARREDAKAELDL